MNTITHNLSLINASYPIKKKINLKLSEKTQHYSPISLQHNVLEILISCIKQCKMEDKIALVSGYRTHEEQIELYNNSLNDNGEEYTRKYVAIPGCSEHESALAIDIANSAESIDFIAPEFDYNANNNQLRQCLFDHGFIQRYPLHKTMITKIAHEPWHFRYVGLPHSKYIQEYDLTLEEYINQINQTSIDCPIIYQNYAIYKTNEINEYMLDNSEISDSNVGFYIVTTKLTNTISL